MWTLRLPSSSQATARRNAQRAAIECGIRRRQREDVERFFQRRHQEARAAALSRARREAERREAERREAGRREADPRAGRARG